MLIRYRYSASVLVKLLCLNAALPYSATLAFTGLPFSSGGKRSVSIPSIAAITPCTAAYVAIRSPSRRQVRGSPLPIPPCGRRSSSFSVDSASAVSTVAAIHHWDHSGWGWDVDRVLNYACRSHPLGGVALKRAASAPVKSGSEKLVSAVRC